MTERQGRTCEKHGQWCPDGICPWCEPEAAPQGWVRAEEPDPIFYVNSAEFRAYVDAGLIDDDGRILPGNS